MKQGGQADGGDLTGDLGDPQIGPPIWSAARPAGEDAADIGEACWSTTNQVSLMPSQSARRGIDLLGRRHRPARSRG